MPSDLCLLAIETATEACSVALQRAGEVRALHELAPRTHSARLFSMLDTVSQGRPLQSLALDAVVYGSGPGSFTGLRIAASATQGLAFSLGVPAIGVSTLAAQVLSAQRDTEGAAALAQWRAAGHRSALVLSTLDAHIGELYWALYRMPLADHAEVAVAALSAAAPDALLALPQLLLAAAVSSPQAFDWSVLARWRAAAEPLLLLGTGVPLLQALPAAAAHLDTAVAALPTLLPAARDLLPFAVQAYAAGELQRAAEVAPVYVRKATEWKTLAEQGSPL